MPSFAAQSHQIKNRNEVIGIYRKIFFMLRHESADVLDNQGKIIMIFTLAMNQ